MSQRNIAKQKVVGNYDLSTLMNQNLFSISRSLSNAIGEKEKIIIFSYNRQTHDSKFAHIT